MPSPCRHPSGFIFRILLLFLLWPSALQALPPSVDLPKIWEASPLDAKGTAGEKIKVAIPGPLGRHPKLKHSKYTRLENRFLLPESTGWTSPALDLGYIDRWVRITVNGRQILPDKKHSKWQQIHPAKPLVIPLPEGLLIPGRNTVTVDMVRKFQGGIYRGTPAVGEYLVLKERHAEHERNFFAIQTADLSLRILFILGSISLWFFERQQRRLISLLIITQLSIAIAAACFFFPFTNELSEPQWLLKIGGFVAILFFSFGVYFFFRFYRRKIPWWLMLTLICLPATGLSTLSFAYFPESAACREVLFQITSISSLIATIASLRLIYCRLKIGDYWSLTWLLVFVVTIPVTVTAWLCGSEYLHSFYTYLWVVYVGDWAWSLLLFGCGITLIVTRSREASYYAVTALQASENERQRIARDLHDGITQQIYAARIQASHAISSASQAQQPTLMELQKNLDKLSLEIRQVCHDLHRGSLAGGLAAALRGEAENITKLLNLKIDVHAEDVSINEATTAHLYLICQEALSNSIKHGQANEISIKLSQKESNLLIIIEDNGLGFDPKSLRNEGLGLKSMQERCDIIEALFTIESHLNQGTKITIALSIKRTHTDGNNPSTPEVTSLIPRYVE